MFRKGHLREVLCFWRILGSSAFMSHLKNFHKTRCGQNSYHARSRWLRNSSIILIWILVKKAADFTLCYLLDHSDDAPSKDYVKPKLERLKRKSSNDNSPNNSFEKEQEIFHCKLNSPFRYKFVEINHACVCLVEKRL